MNAMNGDQHDARTRKGHSLAKGLSLSMKPRVVNMLRVKGTRPSKKNALFNGVFIHNFIIKDMPRVFRNNKKNALL